MEKQPNFSDNDFIYYDINTGRILNEELRHCIETKDTSRLSNVIMGTILKEHAKVKDGYVTNLPSTISSDLNPSAYAQDHIKMPPPGYATNILAQVQNGEGAQRFKTGPVAALDTFGPKKQTHTTDTPRLHSSGSQRNAGSYTDSQKRQMYQNAKNNSKGNGKQSQERNRNNKKHISIKGIILIIMLIISSVFATLTVEDAVQYIQNNYNISRVQSLQAQMLVPPNAQTTLGIVARNTHRTQDFQNYWFDNTGIAEDILYLPDVSFDANLYATYVDMGHDRENAYIDNWDHVIKALGDAASYEKDPIAFARTHGCNTFEQYLIKNGFVNEAGEPDVEKFDQYGKQAVAMYKDYLQNLVTDRNNVAALAESEAPTFGGR